MAANILCGRGCSVVLSLRQLLVVVVVAASICSWMACPVKANCRVENQSGQPVVLVPVVEVGVAVSIDVEIGASVDVPSPQQKCYLKNPSSGHQVGPVTLPDGIVVIVDGEVDGTVDIHVASLLGAVLQLGVSIVIAL